MTNTAINIVSYLFNSGTGVVAKVQCIVNCTDTPRNCSWLSTSFKAGKITFALEERRSEKHRGIANDWIGVFLLHQSLCRNHRNKLGKDCLGCTALNESANHPAKACNSNPFLFGVRTKSVVVSDYSSIARDIHHNVCPYLGLPCLSNQEPACRRRLFVGSTRGLQRIASRLNNVRVNAFEVNVSFDHQELLTVPLLSQSP